MRAAERWSSLGWRHPLWDLLRFYLSLKGEKRRTAWLEKLRESNSITVEENKIFPIDASTVEHFFEYLPHRSRMFATAERLLRAEPAALDFCAKKVIEVKKNASSPVTVGEFWFG